MFEEWNKGELDSFLIEITAGIMAYKDTDGSPLVEKIRDSAGQKGTGKWTAISALDKGMPVTLIGAFKKSWTRSRKILHFFSSIFCDFYCVQIGKSSVKF